MPWFFSIWSTGKVFLVLDTFGIYTRNAALQQSGKNLHVLLKQKGAKVPDAALLSGGTHRIVGVGLVG